MKECKRCRTQHSLLIAAKRLIENLEDVEQTRNEEGIEYADIKRLKAAIRKAEKIN